LILITYYMTPPIRNIVLDTSFIEGQNFLDGTILTVLKDISRKRWADLFITDIVYNEVLSRFRKRLIIEEDKAKNIQNQINDNLKVLKNAKVYKAYFELPKVDVDAACVNFKVDFDKYIKDARIKNISTGHLTIGKVFEDYFAGNPPFGVGEKKSEFPDAFAYQAIRNYFEKLKESCYLVTIDKDFDDLPTDVIVPVKHARTALDAINRFEEEKKSKVPLLIEEAFDREKASLQGEAHKLIISFIEEEVGSRSELGEMEIDVLEHIDLSDIEITGYDIVFIGEGEARLECSANFAYELIIAVEDKSNALYDKEDDRWLFVENTSIKIKDSQDVILSINVEFDEDLLDAEFTLEDINDGKGFEVFSKWDNDYY
jgi:hypothetical protein